MPDGEELSGVGRTSGARNELTRALMQEAVKSGKCPFCSPQFEENNAERIIVLDQEPVHWNVFFNSQPMIGTSYHIMLAPKVHVSSASRLTGDALLEEQRIVDALQLKFGYAGFVDFSRQDDMRFTSATVDHLHRHVLASSGEPASSLEIPAAYARIIDQALEKVDYLADRTGQDVMECLDDLRWWIDVYREARLGKATPIRVKFSNRVGSNRVNEST